MKIHRKALVFRRARAAGLPLSAAITARLRKFRVLWEMGMQCSQREKRGDKLSRNYSRKTLLREGQEKTA